MGTLGGKAVPDGCGRRLGRAGISYNRNQWPLYPTFSSLLQARTMAAQEYYRSDYASRPLSPPTNPADDTSGNIDRHNVADIDGRMGGVPERVTSPDSNAGYGNDEFNTPSSPPHERIPSAYSDTPEYGKIDRDPYEEEGYNPYRKNYNMADEDSKEALVPGVRARRSSGYQDLGAHSYLYLQLLPIPMLISG